MRKENFRIATKIIRRISQLDRLIFGKNYAKRIVIVRKAPEKGKKWIQYVIKGIDPNESDYYEIMGYLDEVMANEIDGRRHISVNDFKSEKSYQELQPFTEDETVIAIAAHEVRHRVQYRQQINLFSPEDANRVKDFDFKCLIKFLTMLFENSPPNTAPADEEFDAMIIEHLAAKKWREGSNLREIAEIIKKDAKNWEK